MQFKKAIKSDIPRLKQLWQDCFSDTSSYIDFYFKNAFKPSNTFVAIIENKIVSMLTALPCLFYTNTNIYKGVYFYAVCTDKDFRSQGISSKLEKFACEASCKNGAKFACLVPAKQELFSFYEKLGYSTQFYLGEKTFSSTDFEKDSVPTNICDINGEYYNKLRQLYLSSLVYSVQFDGHLHDYVYAELMHDNRKVVSIQNRFGHGYITYFIKDKKMIISEAGVNKECFQSAIYEICQKMKINDVALTSKANLLENMTIRPYGMFKSLDENIAFPFDKNPYMNIMLD